MEEEFKRLFYSDRLTQYGKRKLIEYYEQRIKQLEEENRIYGLEGCRVRLKMYIDKNYIPKSLVKEKIEEYQKTEKEMHENKNHSNDINEIYKYAVEEDKAKYGAIVLQELLGEE